jgi:hypothetical protein
MQHPLFSPFTSLNDYALTARAQRFASCASQSIKHRQINDNAAIYRYTQVCYYTASGLNNGHTPEVLCFGIAPHLSHLIAAEGTTTFRSYISKPPVTLLRD